jgi:hypothetical protein
MWWTFRTKILFGRNLYYARNALMNFSNFTDTVQCYLCKQTTLRGKTLILENKKGRFRLCMTCFNEYQRKKEMEDFAEAKDNVKFYGLKSTDGFDLVDKKKQFLKEIMNGA